MAEFVLIDNYTEKKTIRFNGAWFYLTSIFYHHLPDHCNSVALSLDEIKQIYAFAKSQEIAQKLA